MREVLTRSWWWTPPSRREIVGTGLESIVKIRTIAKLPLLERIGILRDRLLENLGIAFEAEEL